MVTKLLSYVKNLNYFLILNVIKNTTITILEIFCLLLISTITIVAIFVKKITIDTLVKKIERILAPKPMPQNTNFVDIKNLRLTRLPPLKQIKQEVLDYLAVEQVLTSTLTSTPTMLALLASLMLALLALNLRSRLIVVLTLIFIAAAI